MIDHIIAFNHLPCLLVSPIKIAAPAGQRFLSVLLTAVFLAPKMELGTE